MPTIYSLSSEIDELRAWLEWAGAKLISLNIASPKPQGTRVSWPIYALDASEAYGYTGERLRPSRVSAKEILLMDQILELPALVPDVMMRRIVHARLLVTPISGRYIYSYSKIAFMLHTDRRRCAALHAKALAEIVIRSEKSKMDVIRHSYSVLTT